MNLLLRVLLSLAVTLPPLAASAYFSTMDTGEILRSNNYRFLSELQYVGDPNGFNFTGGFDAGVSESSNIRVIAGVGSVNFHSGLFFKWVPIPDYDQQPAIGIMMGGVWARYNGENYPGLRFHPIISKGFDTDVGRLSPFVSLPFGITAGPKRNTFPFQLAAGTEWKPDGLENFRLLGEIGLSINEAFSYFSLGATLKFDEENGIQWK